jgi:Amt family ammonium transporter
MYRSIKTWFPALAVLLLPALALAEDAEISKGEFVANNIWMMVATGLVFIMHLGFATLESALCQSKNTVNILFKNTLIPCIGLLTYFVVGFGLMYPGTFNGYLGFSGFGLTAPENGNTAAYAATHGYTYWTDFLFQGMFAATCATIVSGAVAERIKLKSFMFFSTLFVAFVYTIAGSWKWGGGFLQQMGFYDFAGSTLVHSVGGWAALVGAWMLGPRLGKYGKDGKVNPIPGSNMPMAVTGVFLLWLGWFGFNGGSVLSADPGLTSLVLVTTSLAAAAGAVGSVVAYMFVSSKPDLSMTLNGILAGLVGITAGADSVTPMSSIIIGFVAGALVVGAVITFDKIKIDDPVGATSVHLVCGVWGTLAVGIFSTNADHKFMTQLIGVGVYAAFTLVASFLLFAVTKAIMGLRVDPEEESGGLDFGEHGMHAYELGRGGPTRGAVIDEAASPAAYSAAETASSAS